MPIGLVDHFNIVISPSQVDETLRFYREVLGLKEIAPTVGATGSFDHIALNATDWSEMKATLERHGIAFDEQLVRDNTVLQIFFRDPNGLRVELDYKLES